MLHLLARLQALIAFAILCLWPLRADAQSTGYGPPGGPYTFATYEAYCEQVTPVGGSGAAGGLSLGGTRTGVVPIGGSSTCRWYMDVPGICTGCNEDTGVAYGTGTYTPTGCAIGAGSAAIINRTEGWARGSTSEADDYVTMNDTPPTSLCDGSCTATVTGVDSCWRSQVPAENGLHRVSCDYKVTMTSSSCSTKTDGTDSAASPSLCPGYVGQVNGKPVCVGTASTPLPAASAPGGTPPQGYGNPPAGTKPSTGPGSGTGSGRTPVSGDGGPAGGGSNAAIPRGGSEGNGVGAGGGLSVDVELSTCGKPGEPPCKIDETGTPVPGDINGGSGTPGGQVDAARDDMLGRVSSIGAGPGGAGGLVKPEWTWTFTVPTSCSAFVITAFSPWLESWTIDVCEYQPIFHDLMSLIWIITAISACTWMVFQTVKD